MPAVVDDDELAFRLEDQAYVLGDEPFTGIAVERCPGDVTVHQTYVDGMTFGPRRVYNADGRLTFEAFSHFAHRHGPETTWTPDGTRGVEKTLWELGIRLWVDRYDDHGVPTRVFTLGPSHPTWDDLLRARRTSWPDYTDRFGDLEVYSPEMPARNPDASPLPTRAETIATAFDALARDCGLVPVTRDLAGVEALIAAGAGKASLLADTWLTTLRHLLQPS